MRILLTLLCTLKYEPEAIHAYMKSMNSRSMPVEVFKCGLVVYKMEPVLVCSPDGKVIDSGCSKPFGLLKVKCPETKFLLTLLDRLAPTTTFAVRLLMESVN